MSKHKITAVEEYRPAGFEFEKVIKLFRRGKFIKELIFAPHTITNFCEFKRRLRRDYKFNIKNHGARRRTLAILIDNKKYILDAHKEYYYNIHEEYKYLKDLQAFLYKNYSSINCTAGEVTPTNSTKTEQKTYNHTYKIVYFGQNSELKTPQISTLYGDNPNI